MCKKNCYLIADCSKALVIDGHMKGTRNVCDNTQDGHINCEELGNVTVGCKHTPLKGSYYCTQHQHFKQV